MNRHDRWRCRLHHQRHPDPTAHGAGASCKYQSRPVRSARPQQRLRGVRVSTVIERAAEQVGGHDAGPGADVDAQGDKGSWFTSTGAWAPDSRKPPGPPAHAGRPASSAMTWRFLRRAQRRRSSNYI